MWKSECAAVVNDGGFCSGAMAKLVKLKKKATWPLQKEHEALVTKHVGIHCVNQCLNSLVDFLGNLHGKTTRIKLVRFLKTTAN